MHILLLLGILLILLYKLRFYLLSFAFPWLYRRPRIAKFLGIKYVDDRTWITNRKETQLYMPGFFIWAFTQFSGMPLVLSDDIRKATMRLQKDHCDKFDMNRYFDEINGQSLSLLEFENLLAGFMLKECNRVFEIIDDKREALLYEHILTLKSIINSIVGNTYYGLYLMIKNVPSVVKMSRILRSVPGEKRLFLFVPQLTLVPSFTRAIVKTKGDLTSVQPHDLLSTIAKFSVFLHNGQITFVERHEDTSDNTSNKAFGPKGVQCPGAISIIRFYQIIIKFLQGFDITVTGEPKYSKGQFPSIVNKDEITITFKKF